MEDDSEALRIPLEPAAPLRERLTPAGEALVERLWRVTESEHLWHCFLGGRLQVLVQGDYCTVEPLKQSSESKT